MQKKKKHKLIEQAFKFLTLFCVVLPLFVLLLLLASVFYESFSRLGYSFITSFPSRTPELAGIAPALVGSLYLILLTAFISLPIGIGAAVYLEEYTIETRFSKIVDICISNLAGVPSVIYGLLGLEIFVRVCGFGASLLAGAATLALLILPILISASREALRTIPDSLREAALGLGSTKLQCIRRVVLPIATPNILTGSILSVSRAFGETAPLVVVGAATYMAFFPDGVLSDFTALPIQIFNWVSRPQVGFVSDAAAGIVILLLALLLVNSSAVILRNRYQKDKVM